jgi:hypothetical protein
MAIIWAYELSQDRHGTFDESQETMRRSWQIRVDSRYENETTIYAQLVDNPLPRMYSPHPTNPFFTVRRVSLQILKGLTWKCVAEYSTRALTQEEQERTEPNPIFREVKINFRAEQRSKVIVKDRLEVPVVNTAGDPPDPPPEVPWDNLVFHFRLNSPTPPSWIDTYLNSVNDGLISILGRPVAAGYAKFQNPSSGDRELENGIFFYPVEYDIAVDIQTWQLELLNAGMRHKPEAAAEPVACLDADKKEVTAPWPLDEAGKQIPEPTTSNIVIKEYEVYTPLNYSLLPGVN